MTKRLQVVRGLGIALVSATMVAAGVGIGSNDVTANSSQPPAGRTGSPGDGTNCSACHAGATVPITGGITTDIPTAGYTAGQTYNITVGGANMEQAGVSKYGFQLSPQDASGNLLGTLIAGTGSALSGSDKYISHLGAQNSSSPSWTFQWTAPTSGSGTVTFYAAVLAANGNGSFTGDIVVTTTHEVSEAPTSVASLQIEESLTAAVVGGNSLNLSASVKQAGAYSVNVSDLSGKLVHTANVSLVAGENTQVISLGQALAKGTYVVNLFNAEKVFSTKIIH